MLDNFKERIIKLLRRRDYRPVKLAQLAKHLDISKQDYPAFKEAFDQLRQAGRVVIASRNLITLASASGRVVGTFRANPKGFGFVIPTEPTAHGDLFIPPDDTKGAMTGDIVSARIVRKGKRAGQMRLSGEVTEILERANNRFVGILVKEKQGWLVQPDGSGFTEFISVDDVTAKNAKEKDKVVVEILSYPTADYLAHGVIIEVLGKAGRYETEIASIIRQFHIPDTFDENCLSQARNAATDFKPDSSDDRTDLTDKVIITIDPPDAKDFDDAISLEKDSEGNWLLGVHIADVSHFVKAGLPLDAEAQERGNSVYLPQKTIPMLPEVLSNGVCSLQPNQKRFCKSVFITYDSAGKILNRSYTNSVICSVARLTYEQADRILKGHTKDFSPEVIRLLRDMQKLSRAIEARRVKAGMLHLALPEIELIFDTAGRVIDAEPADDSYPHTTIEMFMVEANEAVASLIDRLNIPFMRRIHPDPDALAFKELSQLIKTLGLSMPRNPDRFDVQNLLHAVKGRDYEFAVNMFVLRSMEKAVYAPLDIGHYALAGRHYCHFTSPIRRYADLLVHRVLDAHLRNLQLGESDKQNLSEIGKHITFTEQRAEDASLSFPRKRESEDLTEVGKHITFTEQRAENAEDELKTVLILQMLKGRLGDELDCVVTGMANFGVFARCTKFGIEGLIPIEELGPDKWRFSRKGYCISGLNTGYTIHLGDKVKVRIVSVNIPARQLGLTPAEPLIRKSRTPKTKSKKKFPRKRKSGRRYR
jgi:ribonuclease R